MLTQQRGRQAKSKIKTIKDKMFKLIHLRNTFFIEYLQCARHCARLWGYYDVLL